MTRYKVEGLNYAASLLGSETFKDSLYKFNHAVNSGEPPETEWSTFMPIHAGYILRTLQTIATLIEEEYIEYELFMLNYALPLSGTSENMDVLETQKEGTTFDFQLKIYPEGRGLLRKCSEWVKEHSEQK